MRTGLDDIDPCGDLEFTGSLQVGRVGGDEGLGTVIGDSGTIANVLR